MPNLKANIGGKWGVGDCVHLPLLDGDILPNPTVILHMLTTGRLSCPIWTGHACAYPGNASYEVLR